MIQGDTVEHVETGERFTFVCPDIGGFARVTDAKGVVTYILIKNLKVVKK